MRVSLKATYGIMAALDLAMHEGQGPVQSKTIARRQSIPVRFLEQVLHAMRQAGLVESVRGAQGGYVLRKKPGDTSLADIVEALDGPLLALHRSSRGTVPTRGDALLAETWERLRQAELQVLSAETLSDLVDRARRHEEQRALMYHI